MDKKEQLLLPFPINTNRNVLVLANDLIFARKKTVLTPLAIRTMDWLMTQIKQNDDDFKDYVITNDEFVKLMNTYPSNVARDMAKVSEELIQHLCFIQKPNGWIISNLVSSAEYTVNETGCVLSLRISDKLKPYLLGLKKNFTKIEQNLLLTFKKKHTNELYKIFKSSLKGKKLTQIEIEIKELKAILGLAEIGTRGVIKKTSYNKFTDFKKRVLTPSITELNISTNLNIQFIVSRKVNRNPTDITFTIITDSAMDQIKDIYCDTISDFNLDDELKEKAFKGWFDKQTIEELAKILAI